MAMFIIHQWWWLSYGQLNWATCLDPHKVVIACVYCLCISPSTFGCINVIVSRSHNRLPYAKMWRILSHSDGLPFPIKIHMSSHVLNKVRQTPFVYGYSPYRFCQAPQHSQGETWWTTWADNGDSNIDIISFSYQISINRPTVKITLCW